MTLLGFQDESATRPILSVSDLNRAIKNELEKGFASLWIQGEISNFTAHGSGHYYFRLKDDKAQVAAVMFKGSNAKLQFLPENGMEVVVKCKVSVFEPRGSYQILCTHMEPLGAGALQLAFEQLKSQLKREGLLDSSRKRALPEFPKRIAVVTSPTGAAVQDILNVLSRRFKGLEIFVVPALVQGTEAKGSLVHAITQAQKIPQLDVMIVGRGGGSTEDLWSFNEEVVARAIAACSVPVISAVGHEVDFTIADFVSDLRAPTPSAAAELVVKNMSSVQESLIQKKRSLWAALQRIFSEAQKAQQLLAQRLISPEKIIESHMQFCDEASVKMRSLLTSDMDKRRLRIEALRFRLQDPKAVLKMRGDKNSHLRERLGLSLKQILQQRKRALEGQVKLLNSLSPLQVLERGYVIATDQEGRCLRSQEGVAVGDTVTLRLHKGSLETQVRAINN